MALVARQVPSIRPHCNDPPHFLIEKIKKSEEEWRKILTPEQYRVIREWGTEALGTCEQSFFKTAILRRLALRFVNLCRKNKKDPVRSSRRGQGLGGL